MKTENLNSWLTLIANVGVLIGLILLVLEIRQNSGLMRVQIKQSRAESGSDTLRTYMDSPYIPTIRVKMANNEELTDEESLRYMYYFRSIFRALDNQYWQYNEGYLGPEIPRFIRRTARNVIGRGEIELDLWDKYKTTYSDEYIAFVEEAIADLR